MQPPYRGVLATMLGMTWARGAIFYCSDRGKSFMTNTLGSTNVVLNTAIPPMVTGTLVQIINMPVVRATITIQDPKSTLNSVTQAMVHIYKVNFNSSVCFIILMYFWVLK